MQEAEAHDVTASDPPGSRMAGRIRRPPRAPHLPQHLDRSGRPRLSGDSGIRGGGLREVHRLPQPRAGRDRSVLGLP